MWINPVAWRCRAWHGLVKTSSSKVPWSPPFAIAFQRTPTNACAVPGYKYNYLFSRRWGSLTERFTIRSVGNALEAGLRRILSLVLIHFFILFFLCQDFTPTQFISALWNHFFPLINVNKPLNQIEFSTYNMLLNNISVVILWTRIIRLPDYLLHELSVALRKLFEITTKKQHLITFLLYCTIRTSPKNTWRLKRTKMHFERGVP